MFLGRDEPPETPLPSPMCWGGVNRHRREGKPRPSPRKPRPSARAHPRPPQRHCGGRGFLPYMVMAALAAAALIGGGGGAARQVRGN